MLSIILATLMPYQTIKLDKASFDLLTEKPVSSFTSKKLNTVPEPLVTETAQDKIKKRRYRGSSGC
jgi:hypothetical protein